MTLLPDWREFIELLNAHGVDYVIVGAWARAFHGTPRSTGDIDFFVRRSPENAQRLAVVLKQFGFGSLDIKPDDFLAPERILQLGIDSYHIDIITNISGVSFRRGLHRASDGRNRRRPGHLPEFAAVQAEQTGGRSSERSGRSGRAS